MIDEPAEPLPPRSEALPPARYINWQWSVVAWFPHPCQLLGSDLDPREIEQVAEYLEGTPPLGMGCPGVYTSRPRLGSSTDPLDASLRFDGAWVFPADLAYYVRQGVRLPAPLLARIRRAEYRCRIDPRFPIMDVEDDFGTYWVAWSLSHTRLGWRAALHWLRMALALPIFLLFRIVAPWLKRVVRKWLDPWPTR